VLVEVETEDTEVVHVSTSTIHVEVVGVCCPVIISSSTKRASAPVISWSSPVIFTLPVAIELSDHVVTTFTCCKAKWVQNVVLENDLISERSDLAAVGLMRR
jgi:hypothetical protein